MASDRGFQLGRRIAPPRFVLFIAVLVAGLGAGIPALGLGRGTMAAFDVAGAVFLVGVTKLLGRSTAQEMRRAAVANDANRVLLLAITGLLLLVILVAVHGELKGKNDLVAVTLALALATLVIAWLFSNTVYALHYAHLFYFPDDDGPGDEGGIDFPGTKEPDYWDFVYFSFTLGMTFQTSDVEITSRGVRRVAIGQCLAAFVFNLGVLAFTINTLGGGGG